MADQAQDDHAQDTCWQSEAMANAAGSEVLSLTSGPTLRRRGFLAGSIAGGFAACVAPTGRLLAQVIQTSTEGLAVGDVSIATADGSVPAYFARPATAGSFPTILVVQEVFGVHEYIRDTCRRFAKAGYLAVATELYHRQGDPRQYPSIPELIRNVVAKVPDDQVLADLDATARWAAANAGDARRLGITGFCWGGRIVWLYCAHNRNVKAGVAWYGRLTNPSTPVNPKHPYDIVDTLHAPVLGLHGGKDDGIPLSTVDEMKTRLSFGSAAAQASDFVIYPDAPHAFHADYRPTYRKEAAEDGFARAVAWFGNHLKA